MLIFPDSLESFRTVWKVSRQLKKFLDSLESFRTVWKFSGKPGKFPDSCVNVSGQSEKIPHSWKSCRSVWNVSEQSGKFPDCLVIFGQFLDSLEQFTHFCICHENDLRTFGIHVAEQIYVLRPESIARQSLPTGKLRLFRALPCCLDLLFVTIVYYRPS